MKNTQHKITLGFTNEQFEQGVHICQIFNNEEERHNTLVNFIISSIDGGSKTGCFSDKESESSLSELFKDNGISYKEVQHSGDFSLSKTGEVYFKDGVFEPDRLIKTLTRFCEESIRQNHTGARVIGEMTPDIEHIKGGSRLMEYESKVNTLVRKNPLTAVCQYDARKFDGATLMDILKVHPYMIVRGSIIHNPFFNQQEADDLSKNSE